jgi:hypothetical protein
MFARIARRPIRPGETAFETTESPVKLDSPAQGESNPAFSESNTAARPTHSQDHNAMARRHPRVISSSFFWRPAKRSYIIESRVSVGLCGCQRGGSGWETRELRVRWHAAPLILAKLCGENALGLHPFRPAKRILRRDAKAREACAP